MFEQFDVGGSDTVADVVEPRFEVGLERVRPLQVRNSTTHFKQDTLHCLFELLQFGVFVLRLVEHDTLELDVPYAVADGLGQRQD